jgi:hypothetical protein
VLALAELGALALRHLDAYGVLVRSDLVAGRRHWRRRILTVGVLISAALLAVALICTTIIAAAWRVGAELWASGALAALFILIGAAALWRLRGLGGTAPSQTGREWAKDRQLLEELLQRLEQVKSMSERVPNGDTAEALVTLADNRAQLRRLLDSSTAQSFPRSATMRWVVRQLLMSRSPWRQALRGPLAMLFFGILKRAVRRMGRSGSRAVRAVH